MIIFLIQPTGEEMKKLILALIACVLASPLKNDMACARTELRLRIKGASLGIHEILNEASVEVKIVDSDGLLVYLGHIGALVEVIGMSPNYVDVRLILLMSNELRKMLSGYTVILSFTSQKADEAIAAVKLHPADEERAARYLERRVERLFRYVSLRVVNEDTCSPKEDMRALREFTERGLSKLSKCEESWAYKECFNLLFNNIKAEMVRGQDARVLHRPRGMADNEVPGDPVHERLVSLKDSILSGIKRVIEDVCRSTGDQRKSQYHLLRYRVLREFLVFSDVVNEKELSTLVLLDSEVLEKDGARWKMPRVYGGMENVGSTEGQRQVIGH
jgi:hypothetical protein